ncbi:PTS sugar transporter subunit IIA [Modestobacter roseus]|uniref:PTS system glucose-specific IIA component/PTS system N-acetylglucosamine-specific IIA component n=1 Tax=Modestobacter roseus TaxID=1181884 RepID=A0A562IVS5_9ACTN|nr:glucose PTS transporter subunit IIA [Modestobacter roseus]MQA36057.1 PTS glucose transporter subunit IIA [Modestobacter roseus]TWH75062.1 PTS system glucose-specific IIA component/PTS system N-acetylglucosamine-specific IIA component [Modestobacter roseus]
MSSLVVTAPLPGRLLPIDQVPDPVFAGSLVGAGVAVDPAPDAGLVDAVAPVSGRLLKVHPHAFIVLTPAGQGVLVHLGIDTVKLAGAPFTVHVTEGDDVAAGDRVTTMDVAAVRAAGLSPVTPVVVMDAPAETVPEVAAGTPVAVGDTLFTWTAAA